MSKKTNKLNTRILIIISITAIASFFLGLFSISMFQSEDIKENKTNNLVSLSGKEWTLEYTKVNKLNECATISVDERGFFEGTLDDYIDSIIYADTGVDWENQQILNNCEQPIELVDKIVRVLQG